MIEAVEAGIKSIFWFRGRILVYYSIEKLLSESYKLLDGGGGGGETCAEGILEWQERAA